MAALKASVGKFCGFSSHERTTIHVSLPAAFYLDCIREHGGSPVILITDPGSENPVMATMQSILRSDGTDEYSGENSHRFV